jgi:hypothetical protein
LQLLTSSANNILLILLIRSALQAYVRTFLPSLLTRINVSVAVFVLRTVLLILFSEQITLLRVINSLRLKLTRLSVLSAALV